MRHHTNPNAPRSGVVFIIRQVLNVLFMILGVTGAVMFCGLVGDERTEMQGAIIAMIAVFLKMAECVLRFVPQKHTGQDDDEGDDDTTP